MDSITCNNCDADICEYDMFSCNCNEIKIKDKCSICESSGLNANVQILLQ